MISRQEFTDYLDANTHGSAYPAVSPEVMANALVNLPGLAEQRVIAGHTASARKSRGA